jgi:uncharacterized protein (DUF169 family)
MSRKKRDYSIFEKFNFERKPIGVKFSLSKPEGIVQSDKSLAVCELFREAQTGKPFYVSQENIQCVEHVIGMLEFPPIMYSGQLGPEFSMFKNPGANRRVYDYMPILPKESVKYITHFPIEKMSEDPDVLVITANTTQAEVLLRASSYSTGKMWSSKGSTCLACAWIYAYPYLSGELNFSISGLGFSMKARRVLPEGMIIISVPWDMVPMLIENLEEMEWNPSWFELGREGFIRGVEKLDVDMRKKLSVD